MTTRRFDLDIPRTMHDAFVRGDKSQIRFPATIEVGQAKQITRSMRAEMKFTDELLMEARGIKAGQRARQMLAWMLKFCLLRPGGICTPEKAELAYEVASVAVEKATHLEKADAISEGLEDCDKCSPEAVRNRFGYVWDGHFGAGAWAANPWVYSATLRPLTEKVCEEALSLRVLGCIRCV